MKQTVSATVKQTTINMLCTDTSDNTSHLTCVKMYGTMKMAQILAYMRVMNEHSEKLYTLVDYECDKVKIAIDVQAAYESGIWE